MCPIRLVFTDSWTFADVSQAMEEHVLDPFDALDLVKADDDRLLAVVDVRIEDFMLLVDTDKPKVPIDGILPTVLLC